LKNQAMLITYPDSLGQNLRQLKAALDAHFSRCGVGRTHPAAVSLQRRPGLCAHVLPGGGPGLRRLGGRPGHRAGLSLTLDFMINHISAHSPWYLDFLDKKDASPFRDMFIRYRDFWPGGEPTQAQVDAIYKRRPRAPYALARFRDGTVEKVWCTFSDEQIDLNCESEGGRRFIRDSLRFLAGQGAAMIRLDAFAYAVKRAGGSCFFEEPGVWNLLEECRAILAPQGTEILPEIHEHYTIQQKLVERGYPVYDFALPMLLLNAIYFGNAEYLGHWLEICPRQQYTRGHPRRHRRGGRARTDARRGDRPHKGPPVRLRRQRQAGVQHRSLQQPRHLPDQLHLLLGAGRGRRKVPAGPGCAGVRAGHSADLLCGPFGGRNDLARVERTRTGRDINRHGYTLDEVARAVPAAGGPAPDGAAPVPECLPGL
jgi:sucrose phosphorylase